jgi:hypothetical protein
VEHRVARFFLVQHTKMGKIYLMTKKYSKWPWNIRIYHKIDQISKKYTNIKKNIFVANSFISPFNTQTMHIKSFYTQQHCYVFLKALYPDGIRTQVFSLPRQMWCPLRHADRTIYQHLILQGPQKFTQIWIFGLKIYHLATLVEQSLYYFLSSLPFVDIYVWNSHSPYVRYTLQYKSV